MRPTEASISASAEDGGGDCRMWDKAHVLIGGKKVVVFLRRLVDEIMLFGETLFSIVQNNQ